MEEHRFRVFENLVLRTMFGSRRYEVTGGWRKLHDSDPCGKNSSPSIMRMMKSRRMKWAGNVVRMGEKRNSYRILVGKSEGKEPIRKPRHKWVNNIKMDPGEVGWCDVDWIVWLRMGTSTGLLRMR
jgi:hypothetical protein